MTLCAGVCSYEGRGGLCSIRLSEPLLKLRPRRDLVQTLLHEMIHALLFVTQNNRDRDGHGPEFCKHMDRINQATGTKITVYHSFHEEVDVYRQHWWRCNGPCQNRKPYLGYVKRAMNRAPSPRDPWWNDHQRTCGGTYMKIKEPEGYGKKGKNDNKDKDNKLQKKPTGGTKLPNSTFASGSQDIRKIIAFSGQGFVLGGSSQTSSSTQKPPWQSPSNPVHIPPKPQVSPPSQSPEMKEISYGQSQISFKKPSTSTVTSAVKKSIANHKAFVNINGSPIAKTNVKQSNKKLTDRFKTQLVFQDIFGDVPSPKKTVNVSEASSKTSTPFSNNANMHGKPSSLVSKVATRPVSDGRPSTSRLFDRPQTSNAGGSKLGSVDPNKPRLLKSPQKSANTTPGSRKRPLDDDTSSPIYKFFKPSSSPHKKSEPQSQVGSLAPPVRQAAVQQSTPVSMDRIMVNCPVCHTKMPEVEVNNHLDSCLSG
ncbi:DNA-dependent metalloprotease SPRTN isoform X2 [Clupea harengus]|nr:DNA-dependent metalloprotease SPRTN isoform X2 [Clupea harengus]